MPQRKARLRKKNEPSLSGAELLVQNANSQEDPFGPLIAFHSFNRNGVKLNLKCLKVSSMDKDLIDWAFDLLQRNMQKMYEQSAWGWNQSEKFKEMTEESARYLVSFDEDDKPVAFSHFRFDMDHGCSVLYCYEIQIEEEFRRKGIARFMLQILELMAFRAQLEKVVLTVFLHNQPARQCFKSLGYAVDETSPTSTLEEVYDYEILSKPNKSRMKFT
nr:EOG090X0MNC [Moina brachiata]